MKRKVAIFANGWSNEFLQLILDGIRSRAAGNNVDLYTFINYSSGPADKPDNIGEKSIFELPDLSRFDGVILLSNTINLPIEREYLRQQILKYNLPSVSLEYELEGIPTLATDTYSGVFGLTSHIIKEHGVRRIIYVSGPKDNQENQLRRKAVDDALSYIDKQLTDEDIIYGEWSYYATRRAVTEWLETHDTLPDAFVCANDEMALSTCMVMDSIGIKVPEQVIITGCDCIDQSQKVYPMLSTVAREWDK